ncbi:MAG: hypothetical protein WCK46_03190 [Candidatus Adlerbacteria bacterium]
MPTEQEVRDAWKAHYPNLTLRAVCAQTKGLNWRKEKPVKIGCCVLGHDGRGNFDSRSVGWNNTPRRLSEAEKQYFKPCAEKYAVLHCLKRGLIPVGMMIFTDHNQPDDVTGLQRPAFCSCSYCASWMETIRLPSEFLIETMRPRLGTDPPNKDLFVSDRYSLGRLIDMHKDAFGQKQS